MSKSIITEASSTPASLTAAPVIAESDVSLLSDSSILSSTESESSSSSINQSMTINDYSIIDEAVAASSPKKQETTRTQLACPNNSTTESRDGSSDNRALSNFNFSSDAILSSSYHHPFARNSPSSFKSFYYTNTNTILNKFVMSYEEQMQKAIEKGNYELCKELIGKQCNLNQPFNKRLPLCVACEHNYYDICELFIKHGANVNQFDQSDQSPLLYATSCADLNIIELLVSNGADPNKCDSNGFYPLHVAVTRQNDEICDYLLKSGALLDIVDKQGNTPLAMAISGEYFSMAEKLLTLGADPNIADNSGDTPLIKSIWATMSSTTEQAEISALVAKLVSCCSADVNAKNEAGRTALFTAIYQNNTEIALFLIDHGAKCELEDFLMSNFTLLHYACFQGNYTLTKALLEKKCNPNAIATSCESPVYIAVIKGYLDIVSLLVEYGANVNVFIGADGDNKCTALQAAVYYISDYEQFKKIVNKLIEGNADLNLSEPGPIIFNCLQYNKIDFAKHLVSVGSSVEQRTVFNQSCFYKAFLTKNIEFMQMVIKAGFNLRGEPWISEYLQNPDFIEYTDYYVKRASSSTSTSTSTSISDSLSSEAANEAAAIAADVANKSNQEISDILDMDEYFFERFHLRNAAARLKSLDKKNSTVVLARKIYNLIKHHYTNPLSLKDLARIEIRKHLLNKDFKLKFKIENDLPLPKRLKDYLLLEEFNI